MNRKQIDTAYTLPSWGQIIGIVIAIALIVFVLLFFFNKEDVITLKGRIVFKNEYQASIIDVRGGMVKKVYVQENEPVRKGDPLFQ